MADLLLSLTNGVLDKTSSSRNESCPALGQYAAASSAEQTRYAANRVAFVNTPAVVSGHESTPRFGHTSNLTFVIRSESADAWKDYSVGVLAASVCILAFLLTWVFILIIFKCCRKRQQQKKQQRCEPKQVPVGVAPQETFDEESIGTKELDAVESQRPIDTENGRDGTQNMRDPSVPRNDIVVDTSAIESASSDQADRKGKEYVWLHRARLGLLVSSIMIAVLCILIIVFGAMHLNAALTDTREGILKLDDLTLRGITGVNNFLATYNGTVREVLRLSTGGFCHGVAGTLGLADTLDGLLGGSNQQLFDQAEEILPTLREVSDGLKIAYDESAQIDVAFNFAGITAGLFAALCLVIATGTVVAMWKKNNGPIFSICQRRLIFLLFALLAIASYISSVVFLASTTATADMCYDSPNENVLALVQAYGYQESAKTYSAALEYITQCTASGPIAAVQSGINVALASISTAENSLGAIGSNSWLTAKACGTTTEAVVNVTDRVQELLCDVATDLVDVLDAFSCQKWNAAYNDIMVENICYRGTSGFSWVASTQLLVVLLSLVTVTFFWSAAYGADESNGEGPRQESPDKDSRREKTGVVCALPSSTSPRRSITLMSGTL